MKKLMLFVITLCMMLMVNITDVFAVGGKDIIQGELKNMVVAKMKSYTVGGKIPYKSTGSKKTGAKTNVIAWIYRNPIKDTTVEKAESGMQYVLFKEKRAEKNR